MNVESIRKVKEERDEDGNLGVKRVVRIGDYEKIDKTERKRVHQKKRNDRSVAEDIVGKDGCKSEISYTQKERPTFEEFQETQIKEQIKELAEKLFPRNFMIPTREQQTIKVNAYLKKAHHQYKLEAKIELENNKLGGIEAVYESKFGPLKSKAEGTAKKEFISKYNNKALVAQDSYYQ